MKMTVKAIDTVKENDKNVDKVIDYEIDIVENATKHNSKITMNIALNYGSREEIVSAVKKISEDVKNGSLSPDDILKIQLIKIFIHTHHPIT